MIDVERTILEYEISLYHKEIANLRAQVETLKGEIKSHRRHIQTAEINRNTVRNGAFKEAIEAVRETTDGNAYSVAAIRALISKSESDQ